MSFSYDVEKAMNNKDGFNKSFAARKFECNWKTIKYWLKKRQIYRYEKNDQNIPKLNRLYLRDSVHGLTSITETNFDIEDEKYFTFTHSLNDSYFSSTTKPTLDSIKFAPKQKFET